MRRAKMILLLRSAHHMLLLAFSPFAQEAGGAGSLLSGLGGALGSGLGGALSSGLSSSLLGTGGLLGASGLLGVGGLGLSLGAGGLAGGLPRVSSMSSLGGGLGLSSRYGLAQPLASGFERGERGGSPPTSLGGGGTASLYRGSLGSSNCLSGLGSGLGPLGGLGGGLLGGGLEGAHQQKQRFVWSPDLHRRFEVRPAQEWNSFSSDPVHQLINEVPSLGRRQSLSSVWSRPNRKRLPS